MSKGVRVISPDRAQLRWEMVDLDSQLPDDHRARVVWAFVQGMDLGELYDRIKARDEVAGRPATDPQVVLAVWLYATMEGIGSARVRGDIGLLAEPEPDRTDRRKAGHPRGAADRRHQGTGPRGTGLDEQAQAVGEDREGGGGTGGRAEGRAGQGSRRAGAPAQAAGLARRRGARAPG